MWDPPGRPRWKQMGIKVPTVWNVVIDEFCVSTLGPFGALICDGTADSGALGAFSWLFFSGGNRTEKKRPRGRQTTKRRNKTVKGTTRWNALFYLFIREEREIERKEHLGGPLVDDWLTLLDGQVDDQMPKADDRKGLERLIGPRLMGGQAALSFNTRHAHSALLLDGTKPTIWPFSRWTNCKSNQNSNGRRAYTTFPLRNLLCSRHFRSTRPLRHSAVYANATELISWPSSVWNGWISLKNLEPVFRQCAQHLSRLPLFSINDNQQESTYVR